jgi:hypothetical protein
MIGHTGEMIPFQLARIDQALSNVTKHLKQRPSAYFQSNIHITTSGLLPPRRFTSRFRYWARTGLCSRSIILTAGRTQGADFLTTLSLTRRSRKDHAQKRGTAAEAQSWIVPGVYLRPWAFSARSRLRLTLLRNL